MVHCLSSTHTQYNKNTIIQLCRYDGRRGEANRSLFRLTCVNIVLYWLRNEITRQMYPPLPFKIQYNCAYNAFAYITTTCMAAMGILAYQLVLSSGGVIPSGDIVRAPYSSSLIFLTYAKYSRKYSGYEYVQLVFGYGYGYIQLSREVFGYGYEYSKNGIRIYYNRIRIPNTNAPCLLLRVNILFVCWK